MKSVLYAPNCVITATSLLQNAEKKREQDRWINLLLNLDLDTMQRGQSRSAADEERKEKDG